MPEPQSEFFSFADSYVRKTAALSPISATRMGVEGYDDQLDDFSPERFEAGAELIRESLAALEGIEARDELDRIGMALMKERLSTRLRLASSGEERFTFSVLWSPASDIRRIFEFQPAGHSEDASKAAARLSRIASCLASWRETLEADSAAGHAAARRQVLGVAGQLETYASGAYSTIARKLAKSCGVSAEESGLLAAAADAERACGELAEWMRGEYFARAPEQDAVGPERYASWAELYNGTSLDFEELYQWGYEELKELNARMWELAKEVAPEARNLSGIAEALDNDPARVVHGTDALVVVLRGLTEGAVQMLDGRYFEIDERIRFCDARIAPEGSAGAPYYTGPSEDLTRPGITWYPTLGHDSFPMWRVVSTWYHESVPGHHLQVGTSVLSKERQSRFQRLLGFVSAYGEGWALYAERLMSELGAFSDKGNEMGYLSKQAMRAARVVVDIGLHLGLKVPSDIGDLGPLDDAAGMVWDAELAVDLLVERALVARDRAESEVDRYLGAPGQAISYKVGERVFLACREEAKERLGEGFDLKSWHTYALRLGPMGLGPLADELGRFGR